MSVIVTHTFANYDASAASSIKDEIQNFLERTTMKNVLFLAPGYPYAKTVVSNLSKELDRKKIPYNASKDSGNMFIRTEKVNVEIVYMDPLKYSAELFSHRDAIFGKKELVDTARERYFHMIIKSNGSLSKYISEIHKADETPARNRNTYIPEIKNVYFNDPVTVVLWEDGTKTMVRCQEGDVYSTETGLALCIAKKSLGNMPNFNNIFRKWIPEEEKTPIDISDDGYTDVHEMATSLMSRLKKALHRTLDEV